MAQNDQPISLRGESTRWAGMTTESELSAPSGQWTLLKNCYVSKEGNEIRRFPGWRLAIEPDYKSHYDSWTTFKASGPTGLTQYKQIRTRNGAEMALAVEEVAGQVVIVGIDDAAYGTDGYMQYSGGDFDPPRVYPTIDAQLSGDQHNLACWVLKDLPDFTTPPGANDWGWRTASYNSDWMTANGTHYVECSTRHGTVGGTGGITNHTATSGGLVTVTVDVPHNLDILATGSSQNEAVLIWGRADAALNGWHVVDSAPTSTTFKVAAAGVSASAVTEGGYHTTGKRQEIALAHRPTIDVADASLIMAPPDHGVIYRLPMANEGIQELINVNPPQERFYWNGPRTKIRSLGVPKAAICIPYVLVDQPSNLSDMPTGTYWFRLAYRDSATGEIGLASEPRKVVQTVASKSIAIGPLKPGSLLSETGADEILVYGSEPEAQGGTSDFMGLVATLPMAADDTRTMTMRTSEYGESIGGGYGGIFWSPSSVTNPVFPINWDEPPRILEQMPRPARAVKTMRGVTFSGGSFGDTGKAKAHQRVNARFLSTRNQIIENSGQELDTSAGSTTASTWVTHPFAAGGRIPPSMAGSLIQAPALWRSIMGATWKLPASTGSQRAKWLTNIGLNTDNAFRLEWEMENQVEASFDSTDVAAYVGLSRGDLFFSETAHPGVVPAINRLHLDNTEGEDVEAIGRVGGNLIICTRHYTYGFAWNVSPRGGAPQVLSTEIGAISANSMAEFDGGVAWMSDRGPAAYSGNVEWIGEPLASDFAGPDSIYLRDSAGRMPWSFSCHDRARRLVYFGVIDGDEDLGGQTWANLTDSGKSTMPCNTVLVWSYTANAWSKWVPPAGLRVFWMRPLTFQDGRQRVCFLAEDGKVYGLDEKASDNRKSGVNGVVRAAGRDSTTGTQFKVATTGSVANPDDPLHPFVDLASGTTFLASGMEYVLYDSTGKTVKGTGTITARAVGNDGSDFDSVTFAESQTWVAGDIVQVGCITMEMATPTINFGSEHRPSRVMEVVMRADLRTNDTSASTQPSAGRPANYISVVGESRDSDGEDFASYQPIVPFLADGDTYSTDRFWGRRILANQGALRGHEAKFSITVYGAQQIRVENVELVRGASG